MPNAIDSAINQASQAIDVSGTAKDTSDALSMGMSLAQRKQQMDQANQELAFKQQQMMISQSDWVHEQQKNIALAPDKETANALIDQYGKELPQVTGRQLDPSQEKFLRGVAGKVTPYSQALLAAYTINNHLKNPNMYQGSLNGKQEDTQLQWAMESLNHTGLNAKDAIGNANQMTRMQQAVEAMIQKSAASEKIVTPQVAQAANMSQGEAQNLATQSNAMVARVTSQQQMQAQTAVNKDTLMNAYKMRLDGASRVNDLIKDAEEGKIKTNGQFLGQVNAEISRLETGSQTPGLTAAEKTEYTSAATDFARLKDRLTGKPSDAVSPAIIKQLRATMDSMINSYMGAVNDRYASLASGLTAVQKPIVQAKWLKDAANYKQRFGHWNGDLPAQEQESPDQGIASQYMNNGQPAPAAPGGAANATTMTPNPSTKVTQDQRNQLRDALKQKLYQIRHSKPGTINMTEQEAKDKYKFLTGEDYVE